MWYRLLHNKWWFPFTEMWYFYSGRVLAQLWLDNISALFFILICWNHVETIQTHTVCRYVCEWEFRNFLTNPFAFSKMFCFLFSSQNFSNLSFFPHYNSWRKMSSLSGKAQTVLGLVEPEQLGCTLTHEHLSMDYSSFFCPPSPGQEPLSEGPIKMKNLFWIKQNPYSHKDNLLLCQEIDAVREELLHFKAAGGGTVVENTTTGIRRDMKTLKKLAEETGVHIIAGAGFYVDSTHSSQTQAMTVEQVSLKRFLGASLMWIISGWNLKVLNLQNLRAVFLLLCNSWASPTGVYWDYLSAFPVLKLCFSSGISYNATAKGK